jgi:hypothetical protein
VDRETGDENPLLQNESARYLFEPRYSADGKKVAHWNRVPQPGLGVISLIDNSDSVAETKSDVWIVDNFDPAHRK